jgi:hypothetical protein
VVKSTKRRPTTTFPRAEQGFHVSLSTGFGLQFNVILLADMYRLEIPLGAAKRSVPTRRFAYECLGDLPVGLAGSDQARNLGSRGVRGSNVMIARQLPE